MRVTINLDAKRTLILSALLVFLLVSSLTYGAARRTAAKAQPEQPSIAAQFGNSFMCIFSQCGWPAIVFLILPALAIWFWKKYISLG